MKRWAPWFLVALGLCFLVWGSRSSDPRMLEDSDTVALLRGLEAEPNPWAWFTQDWPLKNHFYRPVSTIVFYVDWVRGGSAEAFGRTNALIACAAVLLCFWLLRELTDSPWMTGIGTSLFASWHLGGAYIEWAGVSVAWVGALCLLGLLRGGRAKLVPCLLALVGCLFLASQVLPAADFSWRIVGWIPGRTASVMTVFALVALACYARFARVTSVRVPRPATSEDLPATKSASAGSAGPFTGVLVVSSCVALLLALGSYEQAVMLPALMLGVWVLFKMRGFQTAWWPHVCFWALLGLYFIVRSQVLPTDVSAYQAQQFRSGPGVWISLGTYLLPSAHSVFVTATTLSSGALLLLTPEFWRPLLTATGNLTTYFIAWKERSWSFIGFLLLGFVAFLPMAWLHQFEHYHYLPAVFRAGYVVALAALVGRQVASAASLPELRAPARPGPAPGSLPRP